MSNNNGNANANSYPSNLITQVSKNDPPKRRNTQDTEQTDEVDELEQNQQAIVRRGFFARLCCFCCYTPPESYEEETIPVYDIPATSDEDLPALLEPQKPENKGKKTLVLDLDETLVHSSFKPIPNPDFIVPVEIEDIVHKVYVLKRPGVDRFLEELGQVFEVVIFTASLSKYADPVLDLLDIHKVIQYRLFRESCSTFKGNYVKDLARIGRDLTSSVIIDNSPSSYIFSQENAIGCESWFDDPNDTELLDLIPFLLEMNKSEDVRKFLAQNLQSSHSEETT